MVHDPVEPAFESTIVFDSLLAFLRHLFADGLSRALALNQAGPAIVRTMEFWRASFAGTIGLAALGFSGGDGAGKKRAVGHDGYFCS